MFIEHIPAMPRLVSGRDRKGHAWTVLQYPRPYGDWLRTLPYGQRLKVARGLMEDFRRFAGVRYGHAD